MKRMALLEQGYLPCGCRGSRSWLHLNLHHPLAYAFFAVPAGVAALISGGDVAQALGWAVAGGIGGWVAARLIP
jgi:hypothetical protein